jgi:hypothetical protein
MKRVYNFLNLLTEKSGNQTDVKRAARVLEPNHVHNARGLATKIKP